MTGWQRNVLVVWLSQFLSIAGFGFAMPFAPYYIQELGVTDPEELKTWVALYAAATPFSLAFCSPIWGLLADRFGRRLMLLRANFAAAIILTVMAGVQSVEALIVLRLLQGMFTGTMTAAQAMVAAQSPQRQSGMALGGLSSAVFSGVMAGVFLGGFCADLLGYRASFVGAGLLTALAGFLVLFGTREQFERPAAQIINVRGRVRQGLARIAAASPLLLIIMATALVRHFDVAMLPLLVQEIHGAREGASMWMGSLGFVAGSAGLVSGIVMGRLADRLPMPRLGRASALGAAVFLLPQAMAGGFLLLFPLRFGMVFFSGGLDPVVHAWLAKITPGERQGFVFGCASSARAIGWMSAGLLSGVVARVWSVRATFVVGGVLFILLLPLITAASRRMAANARSAQARSMTTKS